MATTQNSTTVAEPIDNETPVAHVTRRFKTTDENKTERASIYVDNYVGEELRQLAFRSARWRSISQLLCDAFAFYLDTDDATGSVNETLSGVTWERDNLLMANITPTLFNEIDLMVQHTHTPWATKQEFYICALAAYDEAGYPVVERR